MKHRMLHNGVAKLIEECGELQQIAGKMLNFPDVEYHPDSMTYENPKTMLQRLQEEIADVEAACYYVAKKYRLNYTEVVNRTSKKVAQYEEWEKGDEYD